MGWLLFLVTATVLALVLISKKTEAARAKAASDELEKTKASLQEEIRSLLAEVASLERFKSVRDAEQAASQLREQAEALLVRARVEAEEVRAGAQREAEELRRAARTANAEARSKADSLLKDANIRAERLIRDAELRAESIAGDAYKALQEAKGLEQAVAAMRNLIEGYGDRYLIPTYSFLDQLAEAYGFEEAGRELKHARARSQILVTSGRAAACDYVERQRKETALRFVLDAFNGKVDTILSRVKSDNVGTLEQQIRDAFALVNHNGAAFRSARITPEYLESRLEELKWASAVMLLKEKEREEQRRIRERMREEERARREIERALKEAAKEEEAIQKAIAKVQEQALRATEEQRAQYELKLADLQARLAEAEAKNQRAMSMAQQTKAGHVYVISNIGSFGENVFKIGMTRRLDPFDRVRELGDASVPFPFDVHAMIWSEDAPALENSLHKRFVTAQVNKVNPRKEFFRVAISELRDVVEASGAHAVWTIAAQAAQYRETLAIERSLMRQDEESKKWLEHQLSVTPEEMATDEDAG